LTDAYATWSANQWKGYSIRNLTQNTASSVKTNTATTIPPDGNPQGCSMTFNTGDSYEIRKVLTVLDQPGRGKSDYISGNRPAPATFPNNALEPVRIWGNTLVSGFGKGKARVVRSQAYNLVSGRDWYYSSDNSAALPGYIPYTYPHPLVSEQPTRALPTSTARATATPATTTIPGSPPPATAAAPTATPSLTRGFGAKRKKKADSAKAKKIPGSG
jgi:hypothetical protein